MVTMCNVLTFTIVYLTYAEQFKVFKRKFVDVLLFIEFDFGERPDFSHDNHFDEVTADIRCHLIYMVTM